MSSNCRKPPHQQRGAALIVALVVVLLVVLLATRVSSDYLVLFRTVENQAEAQQARLYLRGAELVAEEALLRDLQAGSDIDSELELWARPAQVPVPEGLMLACLADLQGRLNLNDLLAPAGELSPAQKRFVRLLQVVDEELDSTAALALANAVFDWIDPDGTPRYPGGAEALDYLRVPPPQQPYRPANQPFVSVSELRLVQGFGSALVAALTPHVAVWGNGNLNLNTMDAGVDASDLPLSTDSSAAPEHPATEPVMLRTLNNAASLLPLSADGARLLAAARRGSGGVVQDLALFDNGPLAAQDWELDGLALTSSFFELTAVLHSGERDYRMITVLRRAASLQGVPEVTVMSRRYGADAGDASCAAALR